MVAYKAHAEAVEFIQQYFRDELEGTINTCAREAAACGVHTNRDVIISVRRDMKDEIVRLRRERDAKKEHRLPPVLSLVKPIKLPASTIPVPKEEKQGGAPIEVRRSYYDDIILAEKGITIVKAMRKVTEKYGRSVDVGYALDRLRVVRALYAEEAQEPSEETVKPMNPIKGMEKVDLSKPEPPKPTPQAVGECLIKYKSPAGEASRVVQANKLKEELSTILQLGALAQSIEVFDLVKRKMKFTVSIEFE